jgi:hypothetical protein
MTATAQTIHNKLAELIDELSGCSITVDHLKSEFCDRTVDRNARLSSIAFLSEKSDDVTKLIVDGAAQDGYLRRQMYKLDIEIFNVKEALDSAVAEFRELWNARNEEFLDVHTRLEREKSKVAERLKEHAISSPLVRQQVWEITDGRCIYCDVEMTRERDAERPNDCFEVDHIVAKSNGGPDHLSNYVPACHGCNTSKSAKSIFRFLANRQALPGLRVVGGSEA